MTRAQSSLSSDGLVRIVIAHQDPGVPNWLDPGLNEEGTLTARFLHADRSPEIRFQKVPFSALRECLPEDTPTVGRVARSEILEKRRRAAIRRYRM